MAIIEFSPKHSCNKHILPNLWLLGIYSHRFVWHSSLRIWLQTRIESDRICSILIKENTFYSHTKLEWVSFVSRARNTAFAHWWSTAAARRSRHGLCINMFSACDSTKSGHAAGGIKCIPSKGARATTSTQLDGVRMWQNQSTSIQIITRKKSTTNFNANGKFRRTKHTHTQYKALTDRSQSPALLCCQNTRSTHRQHTHKIIIIIKKNKY